MKKPFLIVLVCSSVAFAQTLSTQSRTLSSTEIKAVLSRVCEAQINLKAATCFPKKVFYTQIERSPKSRLSLNLQGSMGSFSKANSKQIIATGVFNDADGIPERFVGGISVLLEQNKVVKTTQDGGRNCSVFALGNGRDSLICTSEGIGQGNLEMTLDFYDIGLGAKSLNLLFLVDNTAGGCGDPAKTFTLGKLERKDLNNDKKADLLVNFEYKTAPNPNCDVDWSKIKGTNYKLVFLWDGKTLKADTTTTKIIKDNDWKL